MGNCLSLLVPKVALNTRTCLVDNGLVTFLNPYSYSKIRQHGHVLDEFQKIGIDGISLVWLMRISLNVIVERVSFDMTSLAPLVFETLSENGRTVYLIGAARGEIATAELRLSHAFPSLHIVGSRSGYFEDEHDRGASIQNIVRLGPDAVIVGMGTPLQERYLVDLWDAGWRGAGYTCGGFYHQISKRLDYYPEIIDRLHLRWGYRILNEPTLARRYGIDYPRAVKEFLSDARRFRRSGLK